MSKKVVIIGGGAGGASAAARLRRLDETATITILEKGAYVSYANCGLPYYVGGVISEKEKLELVTPQRFLERFNINVKTNNEVITINRSEKQISVIDHTTGEEYNLDYDIIVLSPGAEPIRPPFKGMEGVPVFTLRTIPDTFKIDEFISETTPKSAVVVGGGFIGLEMAENLKERGLNVTVIELIDQVMITLDREMAQYVHYELYRHNIELVLGDGVNSFEKNESGRTVVVTQSGRKIETDMVVLAIGVKPESKLARECNLELSPRGHIVVNKEMQTNDPNIYAVGDAVQITSFITKEKTAVPLAGPANKQGRIAANNIAGESEEFDGVLAAAVVKVFDITVAQVGLNEKMLKETEIDYEKAYLHPLNHAGYYPGGNKLAMKLLFGKTDGKILGAQVLGGDGAEKRIDVISTVIHFGGTVFDLEKLELTYAPPYGSAKDPINMAGFIASNIVKGKVKTYHWHDVDELIKTGEFFMDVRRDDEYEVTTIRNAVHIPELGMRDRLEKLPRDKPIYSFCQEGFRAYISQQNLLQREYDVLNLVGGFKTYVMATATQEELKEMVKNPPFRIIF
jgi:NADPH-dependent 2,4-dienoyl-CoA reductase/sulfur reductase-like enzyme/rhodanese-related sulfurtransferase